MRFERPDAELIKFELQDIITASGDEDPDMSELIPGIENCMAVP